MRILFIADNVGKGGKERRMLDLIRGLSSSGDHSVALITLTDWVDYKHVYDLPIEFIVLKRKMKKDPFLFFRLLRIIRQRSPQIIHSWGSMSNIYSLPIAKMIGAKFITSVIADSPLNLSIKDKEYFRGKLVFPFANVITSNSLAGLAAYKAPREKSVCIYNGFDASRLQKLRDSASMKEELGIADKIVIGMVAAFEDRKDYATLIKAAIPVLTKNSDAVFLLIGTGRNQPEMMAMVPDELKRRIMFLGLIDNVESYVNIFDIGILCTNTRVHQEGISNSIMEYMALEKPVIATSGGGTNELIVDNLTGFLVPPSDPKALEERILDLLEDPAKRVLLGRQGVKRIAESFSIERMHTQFYRIYAQLNEN